MKFEEMNLLINDIVNNISLNAQAKVDEKLKEDIDRTIYLLAKVFTILDKVINDIHQEKVSERDFTIQAILWQGGNSLIGSLQLIRQGYTLEPHFLMRHAVENLALALSFVGEKGDEYFLKYTNNKISGEQCIGEAKKLVTQIGQIYGLLSNTAHPSKETLGYYYMKDRETLMIGGGVTDYTMSRVKLNLAILQFLSTIYW